MKHSCIAYANTYEQNFVHECSIRPLKINFVRMKKLNTFVIFISLSVFVSAQQQPKKAAAPVTTKPTEVNVDNVSSDFFTLIEVFSSDRIGLLYIITRTLFDLHLDIRIAKIGNKGDQSADIFYVVEFDGQKIEDEPRINEIKNALINRL